jgi:hypothetical protein
VRDPLSNDAEGGGPDGQGLGAGLSEVVRLMMAPQEPARRGLDEGDIERIVQRYRLEMARYEAAARFVEQRLRRELPEAAIPVLLTPLTAHSIASIDVPGAIRGGEQAAAARPADERDDVICIALGLMSRHGETFRELASLWRGPSTALKRAILEASP